MNMQEAYDTAASWVRMDENVVEATETFEERQENREQIKNAYRNAQKAASRARSRSVQKRERGHGRSQTQESSR